MNKQPSCLGTGWSPVWIGLPQLAPWVGSRRPSFNPGVTPMKRYDWNTIVAAKRRKTYKVTEADSRSHQARQIIEEINDRRALDDDPLFPMEDDDRG